MRAELAGGCVPFVLRGARRFDRRTVNAGAMPDQRKIGAASAVDQRWISGGSAVDQRWIKTA